MELILCCLMTIFSDPILELDCLNPMNVMVICHGNVNLDIQAFNQSVMIYILGLTTSGDIIIVVK